MPVSLILSAIFWWIVIVTKQSHSMKSLPGLFWGPEDNIHLHLLPLEDHNLLDSPKGFEIHGNSAGERLECETLNSRLSTEWMNGVNDDSSGVGLTGVQW